jgi:hypothetical protein
MFSSNKSILFFSIIVFALFISGSSFAKDNSHQHSMNMNKKNMKMEDSTSMKNKSSIVRSGVIDLKKIDANRDGKVFQDMMDYNVVSDKPGKCPLCGMTLKEVTLKEAKENSIKAGFKVK